MLSEIQSFQKWLRRKAPQSSTPKHYGNDLTLFFAWVGKPIDDVKVQDIDRFIDIRVYDAPDPIAELERLLALHKLHFFPSEPADLLPITPAIVAQLEPILLAGEPFHLGTDPGRKGGDVEQVDSPDGTAAVEQSIPVGGDILSGSAEDAEAGYGDPFTYH